MVLNVINDNEQFQVPVIILIARGSNRFILIMNPVVIPSDHCRISNFHYTIRTILRTFAPTNCSGSLRPK